MLLKPAEARRLIRERADQAAAIPHAKTQMIRRRIDLLSVIRCLKRGEITEGPYVPTNSRTGDWRCNVRAFVDARWLRVVVEIPENGLLVITAIVEE